MGLLRLLLLGPVSASALGGDVHAEPAALHVRRRSEQQQRGARDAAAGHRLDVRRRPAHVREAAAPEEGFIRGLLLSGCQIILFSGMIWLALNFKRKSERWVQTLTGIFGATTVLQLLTLPLFGWQESLVSPDTGQLVVTLPLIIVAAIAIWSLTVMASILRQALEIRIGGAILLVILCQATVLFIISMLIGSPSP